MASIRFNLTPCPASATPNRGKQNRRFAYTSSEDEEGDFLRAQTAGSKPRGRVPFNMLLQKDSKATKRSNEMPKPILRTKDTPPSRSRVVIVDSEGKVNRQASMSRNTFAFESFVNGNSRSPVKSRNRTTASSSRSAALRRSYTTQPGTTIYTKPKERKPEDIKSGMRALKDLLQAIGTGTSCLEFKDLLDVKVAVGVGNHVTKSALEGLTTFEKIIEELSLLWKINRMDLDILEYLLEKTSMLERFQTDLNKFKQTVNYEELSASTERELTTIISSLHNILQGSEDSSGTYTTICFLHYGDVYSFNRPKLICMKTELAELLGIHHTQITYIAKVPANGSGYVTLFQMPCSVSRKLVVYARKSHESLMALGLKGIQVTGSDGLRYTQSLGYLQDKTSSEMLSDTPSNEKLGSTSMSHATFPPLLSKSRLTTANSERVSEIKLTSTPNELGVRTMTNQQTIDLSLLPQMDPNEAKFERRIKLVQSTMSQLTKPQTEELINVLLDQIKSLHKTIASIKKDLKDQTRVVNASKSFVHKAETEIKQMELHLETKAQQISETNGKLLKRVKKLMDENVRLKDHMKDMEAELDMHRQYEKDNKFSKSVRIAGVTRLQTAVG